MRGYLFVGDVHAQATRLKMLLAEMGCQGPDYAPPKGYKVIFLGDLINKGPQEAETIDIVKAMTEAGHARVIMGNHEFKAICYARAGQHGYIRPHTVINTREHVGFLEAFPFGSPAYRDVISWFEQFPIFIKEQGFTAIHSCSALGAFNGVAPFLKGDNALKEVAYKAYDTENPRGFARALDLLLKGPSYKLPRGIKIEDSSGQYCKDTRVEWWRSKDAPVAEIIQRGDQVAHLLNEREKKAILNLRDKFNKPSKHIVFIGHYNVVGLPFIVDPMIACLNFKEHAVGYRWDKGDKVLSNDKLIYV